jgi:biopolymer transport protein ExbD/biopolymer transport protein TolR
MADIMLVLLIIFMITTPLLQDNVVLNLPKAQNPLDTKAKEPFVLSLTRDGRLYLGRAQVSKQEMLQALSERVASEVDKTIFVRADQTLSYGKVVHIVDECRKVGVERIGLMADKEAPSNLN